MAKQTPTPQAATLETARHLAVSGAIKAASLQHYPGGWLLVLDTAAGGQCFITTARSQPRLFKTLETGAKAAQSLFLEGCYIRLDNWTIDQPSLKGM